jgi:hypothetical protein
MRRPPPGSGIAEWETLVVIVVALVLGGLLAWGIALVVGLVPPAAVPLITGP